MDYRSRFGRLSFRSYERALLARQIVVTLVPAACYLLRFRSESQGALLVLALAATVLNFIYYALLVRDRFPAFCRWARLVLDSALWTFLLYYTGGPASFFYVGYLAEIALAAIAVSPSGCLVAAVLSGLGFGVLLHFDPGAMSWEQDVSRVLGLLVIGILCWALARRYDSRNRRMEHLYRELAAESDVVRREAHELRQRLERAERLNQRGVAAAWTLHEWRNTVHGLSGFLTLLKDDLGDDRKSVALVSLIESGIRGMHETAEELLRQSGDAAREHALVDVGNVLRESIAFGIQGIHPEKIKVALREETPAVLTLANRDVLRGAFVNLIRNSLQAMADGGRLDIRCRTVGGQRIQVDITDSGPGIPDSIRARLFEPFVSGRHDGMGLGLAISRRVIEAGGGTLMLGSTSREGTLMIVRLPLHRPPPLPAEAAAPLHGQLSPSGPKA